MLFVQILRRRENSEHESLFEMRFARYLPALLPLDTEVHAHGDGKLLVVDGEDVQDLHINIHIDRSVRDRRLELLVILGQTPSKDTLGHSYKVELCFNLSLSQT